MESAAEVLAVANQIYARDDTNPTTASRPPIYKAIGIILAVSSGLFIGVSFVLKKIGLLKANVKYNQEAGEGYGYLKNAFWWTGMTLMIMGEICNFVAYAFVDAILVTPLGALSVVITTILSAIFLKERLSFVGKIGCFMCIIGSVVIVMNAPSQSSAATIQEMQHFVIAPGFLSYAGVIIIVSVFIALWAGPRYGKKSMLVYLSVCSLIGGLSVVMIQGLGAAVVAQAGGTPQFNQWFLYVLFVFVIVTLVTEIIYLNKALNIFNAALVTPTYYVYFTSSTIITSAILFRGFKGTPTSIITVVMGFFQICAGVVLLQLSKSAKDVPDAKVFTGDLDQVRTVAEQEEPESEPKADAIRGTAAIIRRISMSRQNREAEEARRVQEDKLKDQMEPIAENEEVQWDGLRRRKTIMAEPAGVNRRKSQHPPLGLTRFPDEEDDEIRPQSRSDTMSTRSSTRRRPQSTLVPGQIKNLGARTPDPEVTGFPKPFTGVSISSAEGPISPAPPQYPYQSDGSMEMSHVSPTGKPITWASDVQDKPRSPRPGLAPPPPLHSAKRQFSFQNVFSRHKNDGSAGEPTTPLRSASGRTGPASSKGHQFPGIKTATEEERLGLVRGDSSNPALPEYASDEEEYDSARRAVTPPSSSAQQRDREKQEYEGHEASRQRWAGRTNSGSPERDLTGRARGARWDEESLASEGTGGEAKEWEGGRGGSAGGAFI